MLKQAEECLLEVKGKDASKEIQESDTQVEQPENFNTQIKYSRMQLEPNGLKEANDMLLSSNTNADIKMKRTIVTETKSFGQQIHESFVPVDQTEEVMKDSFLATHVIQGVGIGTSEEKTENSNEKNEESDVEQVLFAVTPKKRLKDVERPQSIRWDEKIFDMCVYIPREKTWYFFGEGKNDGGFRKICETKSSWSTSSWSHNFCTKDHLCLASPSESRLYMYPLKCNDNRWGPSWSHVSYKDIVHNFPDFHRSSDVRFCCSDGETIYIVIRKKIYEDYYNPETKVGFKCFRLSTERSWDLLFETRYLLESEDYQVYDSMFDVHVSPENNVMLIAVESRFYLHTFFVNLQDKQAEIRYNFLEPGASMLEDLIFPPQTGFWIIFNGERLCLVDELVLERKFRYYRFMEVDNSKDLSIGYTGHEIFKIDMPTNDYKENTKSELIHSVCDSRSAWVFLSDGRFNTLSWKR